MQNAVTIIVIVLVVLLVLTLVGGAGMMGGFGGFGMGPGMMGGGGMMGGYGGYGYGFNPLGTILSLVFWALIIGGVALLVVWLVRSAKISSASSSGSPLDILKARYARGEINKEQFESVKRDLGA